jgi:UDP-glucose 4-epimerase
MARGRKILVTGGAGYIGSHVVQELCAAGHQVLVFDNLSLGRRENIDKRARFLKGDLLNESDLEEAFKNSIDTVFHFAAWKAAGESMADPGKYAVNNICGTIHLLNAMVKNEVRAIIFSSSAAVYGNPQYLPIDENHPLNPANYYGYSKLAIEQNLEWFSRLKGIRYAALRYFNAAGYDVRGNIRGKEKNPANLSPVVMEVVSGIRKKMQLFGNDYDTRDGTCIRDYIHVTDLATAHLLAMDFIRTKKQDLKVNLGSGSGYSVLEMIHGAERVTGKSVPHELASRRQGDPAELVASYELAGQLLGWKPRYSDLETIFRSMKKVYLE